jgi:hypothetical protein
MGQAHTCGQHGYPDGDSTRIQPVLDGGLRYNTVNNDDCVTGGIWRSLKPSLPIRRPSRQAMDIPYNTMVSFTKRSIFLQESCSYSCRRRKRTRISGSAAAAGKLRFRSEMLGALSAGTHAVRSVFSRKCDSSEHHFSVRRVPCLVNSECLNILTFACVPWVEKRATFVSTLVFWGGYTDLARNSLYAARISWGLSRGVCQVKKHSASVACIRQKSLASLLVTFSHHRSACFKDPRIYFAFFLISRSNIAGLLSYTLARENLSLLLIPYSPMLALLT